MRICSSCVVLQDSILQTELALNCPAAHFLCSTARIGQDITAASFCSCKLLWKNDECVLLPCLNGRLIFLQLWTAVP